MSKIIAIASGKGGVGKTTTAINLSLYLHDLKKNVILIDGNLTTPHIGLYLGMNSDINIHDVFLNNALLKNSLNVHQSGIPIILGSILSFNNFNKEQVGSLFENIRGLSEITILDLCTQNNLLSYADDVIIVTQPDIVSLTDALRTIKYAEEKNVSVLGVVVNRRKGDAYELSDKNIESFLGKNIISSLPESDDVKKSVHIKYPIVKVFPNSEVSRQFGKVAEFVNNIYSEERRHLF